MLNEKNNHKGVKPTLELKDFALRLNLANFKEVSGLSSSLEKAKAKESDDLEKGQLGEALSYNFSNNNKFKKTGKEIKEKIEALVVLVNAKKDQAATDLKKIEDDLGFSPNEPLYSYEARELPEAESKLLRTYGWNQCDWKQSNANTDMTGASDKISVKCAANEEEAKKCRAYNTIMYAYVECFRDLGKADTFLRNVDEKTSYVLSLDELKSLGF